MSLHIVGAENLAQDQAVEVIVKFGRDKQPPYTPPTPKTIEITENGEHNVKGYDVADVDVPGIEPTGTLDITANANNIDVAQYAAVNVNVPSVTPTLPNKLTVQNTSSVQIIVYAIYMSGSNITYGSLGAINAGNSQDIELPAFEADGVSGPYPLVIRCPKANSLTFSGNGLANTAGYYESGVLKRYPVFVKNSFSGYTLTVASE